MSDPAVISPAAFTIARPEPGEFAPYYERYISLVAGTDILGTLDAQRRQTLLRLSGRDDRDGEYRYAPGKWSAKEVLGHVCDTERVFAYRALQIARGDQTPLAGFEQDDYVKNGPFAKAPMEEIIEDYIAVRRATITLFRNLDEAAWVRRGVANNNEVSVRASPTSSRDTSCIIGDSGGEVFCGGGESTSLPRIHAMQRERRAKSAAGGGSFALLQDDRGILRMDSSPTCLSAH